LSKKIKTFNPNEFLDEYMNPDPKLYTIIKQDYGRFFIVNVQDLIKLSKLPVPPTRASTHTIIFLTSGIATMNIGFQKVEIHKNECLIVPAGKVFGYDNYEVNKGFLCTFDNDFLLGKIGSNDLLKEFEFLNIWANPIIALDTQSAKYLQQTFQRVFDEYSKNGLKNTNIIQSYFIAALCDLQPIYKPHTNSKSKTAITLTNRFKELLHKHIKEKHLVTDYASMLNVSPNHLNKSIKEVTQKPATKWIDETLVLEAKVLLFQTNNSINEIASELGIYDQSYFSRLFKKYEGVTPLEYRKMIETS
jgi:AraC family transcriptional regulator, transcriptional activator of pobA